MKLCVDCDYNVADEKHKHLVVLCTNIKAHKDLYLMSNKGVALFTYNRNTKKICRYSNNTLDKLDKLGL